MQGVGQSAIAYEYGRVQGKLSGVTQLQRHRGQAETNSDDHTERDEQVKTPLQSPRQKTDSRQPGKAAMVHGASTVVVHVQTQSTQLEATPFSSPRTSPRRVD